MGLFDRKKINAILEEIDAIKKDAEANGRFSFFHTQYAEDLFKRVKVYNDLKYFYDLFKEHDENYKIPYEVGMNLDKLIHEKQVFIHRTNLDMDISGPNIGNNVVLGLIMEEGLANNGHAFAVGGGAYSDEPPSLGLTMSPLGDVEGYINLVSSYKDNDTIVIAAFPKEIITMDGEPTRDYSDIYDLSQYPPRVKTEYMVGAIVKKDEGLWDYYTRDEILKAKQEKEERGRAMH